MRMRSALPLVSLLLLGGLLWSTQPVPLRAQSSDATSKSIRSLLLEAKTTLNHGANTGSLDSLRKARAVFKQVTEGSQYQALAHYYAALADRRMLNQLPQDAKDKREPVVNDAIEHLEEATQLDSTMADAWALLTSCYGQMMGLYPMKGRTLGPKSEKALKMAKELAPENPRVWLISGQQDYFTPEQYGGDKERALNKFQKAARLAEQETVDDPLHPSWGHVEAYFWLGYAHLQAERYEQARTALEKALDVNPNYGPVKSGLMPELEKKTE